MHHINVMAVLLLANDPLQREFEDVAMARKAEILRSVKAALTAFKKGDTLAVAAECTMYDAKAKERDALTRDYLLAQKDAWQKAAERFVESELTERDIHFESPAPERGMPAKATVYFGPKLQRPTTGPRDSYPDRHAVELWWSGAIMPDANGPVFKSPRKGAKMKWEFYQLVLPYSRQPTYLQ